MCMYHISCPLFAAKCQVCVLSCVIKVCAAMSHWTTSVLTGCSAPDTVFQAYLRLFQCQKQCCFQLSLWIKFVFTTRMFLIQMSSTRETFIAIIAHQVATIVLSQPFPIPPSQSCNTAWTGTIAGRSLTSASMNPWPNSESRVSPNYVRRSELRIRTVVRMTKWVGTSIRTRVRT